MCVCTPSVRTPCCENCPPDLKKKWGFDKPIEQKQPIDTIIHALTIIATVMNENGIDTFDLSIADVFKFHGEKKTRGCFSKQG